MPQDKTRTDLFSHLLVRFLNGGETSAETVDHLLLSSPVRIVGIHEFIGLGDECVRLSLQFSLCVREVLDLAVEVCDDDQVVDRVVMAGADGLGTWR